MSKVLQKQYNELYQNPSNKSTKSMEGAGGMRQKIQLPEQWSPRLAAAACFEVE
jgi:hypothetical protein